MGLRREEIDSVCTECGKIVAGPHKGETMQPHERVHVGEGQDYYKATPLSGTVCEDCMKKPGGPEAQMEARHGADWQQKVEGTFEETERRSAEKRAQAERERTHIWWRKPGEK